MNWTRGLFRLWLVLTVVWLPVSVALFMEARQGRNRFADLAPMSAADVAGLGASMVLPPLAVLIAFLTLRWVWRGFR